MLGLHLGSIALLFDQGLVLEVTQDPATAQLRPYGEVMAEAIAALDQAIVLSQQTSFTIPAEWMSVQMSSAELARLAYAYKARFRANVARTPAERSAVNWAQVIADANNGIYSDFNMEIDWSVWENNSGFYMTLEGPFSQMHYQYLGMADQSGNYQTWINLPVANRHPVLPGGAPFLIITPDNRFPQGATLGQQRVTPGRYYQAHANPAWGQPTRGTHRWSFYADQRFRSWRSNNGPFTWFPREELDMLLAEGYYRLGDLGQVAMRVNPSRVAAGLNATNPGGTNTSCVPRLPNGQCGGLFEMLKWEYRLETQFQGMFGAPWYFLARGWGDDTAAPSGSSPCRAACCRRAGWRATRSAAWAATAPRRAASTPGRSSDPAAAARLRQTGPGKGGGTRGTRMKLSSASLRLFSTSSG